MNINAMEQTAVEVSHLMKMLSAPNRLLILCQLVESEKSVGQLCELLGLKPPAMSQQLSLLRREGLIDARRQGQSIFYSISDKNLLSLLSYLYETYCKNRDKQEKLNA
jgi:DNA-binding transcriptional ArsR family regulator